MPFYIDHRICLYCTLLEFKDESMLAIPLKQKWIMGDSGQKSPIKSSLLSTDKDSSFSSKALALVPWCIKAMPARSVYITLR